MTDQNEIEDDLTDGGLAEKKSADQHGDRLLTRCRARAGAEARVAEHTAQNLSQRA